MKRIALVVALVVCASFVTSKTLPATADDQAWVGVVPGEYLVELKPDALPDDVAVALGVAGLEPLGAGGVYRVMLDPYADPATTVSMLTNTPGIGLAQPNLFVASVDYLGLRKRFFSDLEPAAITTSSTGYSIAQPGLGNAGLPAGSTAKGVRVAVLDTGVDLAHPRLASRLVPGGHDFIDGDRVPSDVANGIDDNANGAVDEAVGHGTYVAGLVALVAPGARILPVRVLDSDGSGTTWTMMQGLAFATASGARVINMSFGGSLTGLVVERQLDRIREAGVIVVAAGGNDASEVETYPAASDRVVGVTAVNGVDGTAATFANRGSWLDVAAPGVRITSTYPGGRYAVWGGTSASAPIVTGVLAIAARAMPGAAVDDIVDRVTSTARADGLAGLSAYGRIDARAAIVAAMS